MHEYTASSRRVNGLGGTQWPCADQSEDVLVAVTVLKEGEASPEILSTQITFDRLIGCLSDSTSPRLKREFYYE